MQWSWVEGGVYRIPCLPLRQWRSQGGGQGGHGPPKLSVNVFFCNEFRNTSRSGGNVKKMSPNEGDLSDRDMLPQKKLCPLLWSQQNSATTPPPPTESGRLMVSPENFCYYPPPPHWIWPAYGEPGKFLLLPPPHRIWSACGDHGKVAPPKQKSWLRRCAAYTDQWKLALHRPVHCLTLLVSARGGVGVSNFRGGGGRCVTV